MISIIGKIAAMMFAGLLLASTALAEDYDYAVEAYNADDYAEALPVFLELAENGDDDAMWYLGKMYDFGYGVEQSDSKAFNWFKKSADLGDTDSMYEVAVFFQNGQGMPVDQKQAFKWYLKSAEGGHIKAMTQVGIRYEDGNGVRASAKKAYKWFRKASEEGEAVAQAYLGYAYEFGEGVRASEERAVYWYAKSAEQEDDLGLAFLAAMYRDGTGVPRDRNKAIDLFSRSAAQGNEYAQNQLDAMGASQTSRQAQSPTAPSSESSSGYVAADTDDSNCNYDLDMADMKPDCQYGVALRMVQDLQAYDSALPILLRLSSDHAHADAAHLLGVIYYQAEGWSSHSPTESFNHYLTAANLGHPEAQAMVGGAYLAGEMGQAQNQSLGVEFIQKAARQGHQRSQDFLTSQNITW